MPSGGRRRNTGSKPGPRGPHKATIEKALIAEQIIARAEMRGEKLAKEVLNDFMKLFAGMAAVFQPVAPNQPIPVGRDPNDEKFDKYARLAVDTAAKLAPYQSPTFRAIVVAPAPDQNQPERRKIFQLTVFDAPPPARPPVTIDQTSDAKH